MLKSVNYDNLSDEYNKRYKSSPLEGIAKEIDRLLKQYNPNNVFEIGCGTGHWLTQLSMAGVSYFGFDYSMGMLKNAKVSKLINLVQADANLLPARQNCADMVFAINALHHFKDPMLFVKSAAKMLSKGGVLSIIGLDPEEESTSWYIYDFFKGIHNYDLNRYPSFENIRKTAESNGLKFIECKEVHTVSYELINMDVLTDTFLKKNQASQLAALSEKEYAVGIKRINETLALAKENNIDQVFRANLIFKSINIIKK